MIQNWILWVSFFCLKFSQTIKNLPPSFFEFCSKLHRYFENSQRPVPCALEVSDIAPLFFDVSECLCFLYERKKFHKESAKHTECWATQFPFKRPSGYLCGLRCQCATHFTRRVDQSCSVASTGRGDLQWRLNGCQKLQIVKLTHALQCIFAHFQYLFLPKLNCLGAGLVKV